MPEPKNVWDLEEELKKNAPKIDGLEFEKIIGKRTWDHLDKDVALFVPFTPDSDFTPADAYKDAVKAITPAGVAEKYHLLASVAKLATAYKSRAIIDLKHYTYAGRDEEIEKHKDELKALKEAIEQNKNNPDALKDAKEKFQERIVEIESSVIEANLKKNNDTLADILKNTDAAFSDYTKNKGQAIVTPGIALHEDADYLYPDNQGVFLQNASIMGGYIEGLGTRKDLKNYATGKRIYVTHYKTVKDEQTGKEGKIIDRIEVWKKKEN